MFVQGHVRVQVETVVYTNSSQEQLASLELLTHPPPITTTFFCSFGAAGVAVAVEVVVVDGLESVEAADASTSVRPLFAKEYGSPRTLCVRHCAHRSEERGRPTRRLYPNEPR